MNFKKKVSGSWVDTPHYIYKTATDTITTLPADLYADGTNATVGLVGNTTQSGTPSPSAPVDVVGCGDLETSGEHAGQYKIPILNGSVTTNVYLGEVQTTRNVKKLVLTGTENGGIYNFASKKGVTFYSVLSQNRSRVQGFCTHYPIYSGDMSANTLWIGVADRALYFIGILDVLGMSTFDEFKTWAAQQYANGTPITIYYPVTEQITTLNEPLMKIGNYADSLTTSIPTTDGANTISVNTTVQPSEVSATYHGWHPVADAHERENGVWT